VVENLGHRRWPDRLVTVLSKQHGLDGTL
jgi:hypothetical protein